MMKYVLATGDTDRELEEAVNSILGTYSNEVKFLGGVHYCVIDGFYLQALLVYYTDDTREPAVEPPMAAEDIAKETGQDTYENSLLTFEY